jgi:hypothetical protein
VTASGSRAGRCAPLASFANGRHPRELREIKELAGRYGNLL